MSFSIRRRLSSIIAPFTVAGPYTAPTQNSGKTRLGSGAPWKQFRPDEQKYDDRASISDDSDRKSYDLSETASGRSFDVSGSEASYNSDSQHAYSGLSDMSSGSESEEDAEINDKYDLMASHLYQVAEGKGWFRSSRAWGNSTGIVSIR